MRNCHVSPNLKDALLFCSVVQCKSTTKSMKMCLEVFKVERKKIEWKCMSMHMISVKHVFLLAVWCVLALKFSWSDNHFFFAVLCRRNTFWSMYPGTVWHQCFELQYLKKKSWGRKNIPIRIRISTTAAKVVTEDILGKTPVSLPITTGYSLPPTWDRFRQKRQSNGEWQGKTARACIASHTFLIDGSWLLPTKRLFRSAANFDFHDNRPKMADLKSVMQASNFGGKFDQLFLRIF